MKLLEIFRPIPVLHLAITMVVVYLAALLYLNATWGKHRANYILACTISILVALLGVIVSAFLKLLN